MLSLAGKTSSEILSRKWDGQQWRYRWDWANPLVFPRRHVNATLLLDGRVLVTGGARTGNEDPVLHTELFDPETGSWRLGAICEVGRVYHSMAALLPDGRVWTGGGNPSQGNDELRIELYTPGYCMGGHEDGGHEEGERPVIEDPPKEIPYDTPFRIKVKSERPILKAALVRASSVTHSFNVDQRWVGLALETREDGLELRSPPRPAIAPPGYYLLTVLEECHEAGEPPTPSVGHWVRLVANPP
jgi:hypothetical protein